MTDQPTNTRKEYPPIPVAGDTFLIVDRTDHTQNVSEVNGTFEQASDAAEERAASLREPRDVFIFKKVAVCEVRPAVRFLDADDVSQPEIEPDWSQEDGEG